MRRLLLTALAGLLLLAAACGDDPPSAPQPDAAVPAATGDPAAEPPLDPTETDAGVNLVIAPAVRGKVDEALVLEAFRQAAEQAERDFGVRSERTVTIYVDPDSSIGLEDALGLSAKHAIHLRASRTQRMDALLPLMMHEFTHVLQYQVGRLRPQWWIEGQAEHQSQRVLDPGRAEQARKSLLRSLAGDLRSGKAPTLETLRGSGSWDAFVKSSGAGRAYGWGHAAVAFIDQGWGFDAVAAIMQDREGPNTYGSFDAAIQRETGLDPAAFEREFRAWVAKNG